MSNPVKTAQDHQPAQNNATSGAEEFQREAQSARVSLIREFWEFLNHNKKWWLLPILLLIFALGLLIILGATGAAPFIYTLF